MSRGRVGRGVAAAGFTIIETMIVLAIAGVFLLIVFEAIPTLERNSRNDERKQDVAAILAAISHYELNHSGNFPAQPAPPPGDNFLQYTNLIFYSTKNAQGFYTQINVAQGTAKDNVTPLARVTDPNSVTVENYAKCDSNDDGGASNAAAGYTDAVGLYAIEAGPNSASSQCQQL